MSVGTSKHAVISILPLFRADLWPARKTFEIFSKLVCFFLTRNRKRKTSMSSVVVQPWSVLCPCVQVWSRTLATCATMLAAAGTTWRPTWTGTTPRGVTSAICAARSSNPKSRWKATDWATLTKVRVSLSGPDSFFCALIWDFFCSSLSADCWMCIVSLFSEDVQ